VADLRNEVYVLERAEERRSTRREGRETSRGPDDGLQVTMTRVKSLLTRVSELVQQARNIEDLVLVEHYRGTAWKPSDFEGEFSEMEGRLSSLYLELYAGHTSDPNQFTLVLFRGASKALSEGANCSMLDLAAAYCDIAKARDFSVGLYAITPQSDRPALNGFPLKNADDPVRGLRLHAERIQYPHDLFEMTLSDVLGIGIEFRGEYANPFFAAEVGRHTFVYKSGKQDCAVDGVVGPMREYHTPYDVTDLLWLREQPLRRKYHKVSERIEDKVSNRNLFWRPKKLAVVLSPELDEQLHTKAKAWVHGD